MESKQSFTLPEDLAKRLQSLSIRNAEVETVLKVAIKQSIDIREEIRLEGGKVWGEIGDLFGLDMNNQQWTADIDNATGVVVISEAPAHKLAAKREIQAEQVEIDGDQPALEALN